MHVQSGLNVLADRRQSGVYAYGASLEHARDGERARESSRCFAAGAAACPKAFADFGLADSVAEHAGISVYWRKASRLRFWASRGWRLLLHRADGRAGGSYASCSGGIDKTKRIGSGSGTVGTGGTTGGGVTTPGSVTFPVGVVAQAGGSAVNVGTITLTVP